ncbi:MAG: MFS transporter [Bifidobacterium sp.]|jgi:MFS family permease|nr:MFS transporter [Bifidobacterium sp.]MCI1865845.1 MFS transporter [Bifidobacterium sp.]
MSGSDRTATVRKQPMDAETKTVLAMLLPAIIALYGVYQAIVQVLQPAQIMALDPANKVHDVAMLSLIESVVGTIILPVGAAISDRTRSRLGRRAPWLLFSAAGIALSSVMMGLSSTIALMMVTAGCVFLFANWFQGVIYAVIPDRIPQRNRGVASSITGLGLPLGILIFVNLAARTSRLGGYTITGLAILVVAILFVVITKEKPSYDLVRPQGRNGGEAFSIKSVGRFFSAFTHRDFTMAFLSRFAFFFAFFGIASYTFYILSDYVGKSHIPGGDVATGVATLSTISTVAQILAILVFGKLADHFDRRKAVVALSAIVYMIGFIVPLLFPTWIGMVIYSAVSGAAAGVYFAVDIAVMSLVLPTKENEGRDLGILAIATSIPAAVAPLIGSGLIGATGSYVPLFVFGIAMALLGGIFAFLIRSIR